MMVSASVTNTGDRDGDEVVQVYIRDPVATVTRPVLELKAFARVHLRAGATKQIVFRIPVGQLGFYDADLSYVVEPGILEVRVGSSSQLLEEAGSFSVHPDPSGPVLKVFDGSCEVIQAVAGPD